MKLVLVSQEFPPSPSSGGIGSQTAAKARGLTHLGHDVTVVTHSPDARRHDDRDGPVRVVRLPGPDEMLSVHTEAARWVLWSGCVATELAALRATDGADLVEFADWGSEGYVHLLNQTPWSRVPSIVHMHGPVVMFAGALGWPEPGSPLLSVARHMERTCLQLADRVYSSSRTSLEWVRREHEIDLSDAEVLHTGVDTRLFTPRDRRPGRTVVSVGKLTPTKGVDLLVTACAALVPEMPDLRLRLVGRGGADFLTELERQARGAGLDLELCGYAGHEQLPALLADADAFCAPSRYEGGPGLVLLEAMACGLPVICCGGSGASESVDDGRTGRVVPPGDAASLVSALREMLGDPARARQMGREARAHVVATSDTAHAVPRIADLYEGVISAAAVRA